MEEDNKEEAADYGVGLWHLCALFKGVEDRILSELQRRE